MLGLRADGDIGRSLEDPRSGLDATPRMIRLPSSASSQRKEAVVERVRVGVVGCGLVAQLMHLHYLRELGDRFVIAALCDVSAGTLAAVADTYDVARRYTDWRRLLDDGAIDALMVLTSASHAEPAIAAFEQGLHVFVEKPIPSRSARPTA
jgi:hypothetical protein